MEILLTASKPDGWRSLLWLYKHREAGYGWITNKQGDKKTHSECKVMGQGRCVEVLKDGVLKVWKF